MQAAIENHIKINKLHPYAVLYGHIQCIKKFGTVCTTKTKYRCGTVRFQSQFVKFHLFQPEEGKGYRSMLLKGEHGINAKKAKDKKQNGKHEGMERGNTSTSKCKNWCLGIRVPDLLGSG